MRSSNWLSVDFSGLCLQKKRDTPTEELHVTLNFRYYSHYYFWLNNTVLSHLPVLNAMLSLFKRAALTFIAFLTHLCRYVTLCLPVFTSGNRYGMTSGNCLSKQSDSAWTSRKSKAYGISMRLWLVAEAHFTVVCLSASRISSSA